MTTVLNTHTQITLQYMYGTGTPFDLKRENKARWQPSTNCPAAQPVMRCYYEDNQNAATLHSITSMCPSIFVLTCFTYF